MKKVLYFTAGPIPTPQEQADIAALRTLAEPAYEVGVRNGAANAQFGTGRNEPADYAAGVIPTEYNALDEFDVDAPPAPDTLPDTQTVVTDGQKVLGVTGSGTVANIAVDPDTKEVTVTLSAS